MAPCRPGRRYSPVRSAPFVGKLAERAGASKPDFFGVTNSVYLTPRTAVPSIRFVWASGKCYSLGKNAILRSIYLKGNSPLDFRPHHQFNTEKRKRMTSKFVAGTIVQTNQGGKPIEEIRVGDLVLSYPCRFASLPGFLPKTEFTYRKVVKTCEHPQQPLLELNIFDLAAGFKESIVAAPDSLFFHDNEGGWISASKMHFGGALVNAVFGNLLVSKVRQQNKVESAYSIEIEDFHTCYIGRVAAWVRSDPIE